MKKRHVGLIIAGVILLLISVSLYIVYLNVNRILSNALHNAFENNAMSDVYELNFNDLSVNFLAGNINVKDVVMQPLKEPVYFYPYINSTFILTTKKLELENVNIYALLSSGSLQLDKILIDQPEIELNINGDVPIFFPLNDTTFTVKNRNKKKAVMDFKLDEFKLKDASIHVLNTSAKREFDLRKLTISLNELIINQHTDLDELSYKNVNLSIESLSGIMQNEALKHVSIKDFKLKVDSLHIQKTIDTLMFHFSDFSTGLASLDVQTADSIFHIAMGPFSVSYKEKSLLMSNIVFKQNISNDAMQRRHKYQHTQFGVSARKLSFSNVQFDSLIYNHKVFIEAITADSVNATIYKDKTRPIDTNRFPKYFGEQVMSIPVPLMINEIKVTNANLANTERKADSTYARVKVNRGTVTIKNITNLSAKKLLVMQADAYIENKAHAYLTLGFDYAKPQFSIEGRVKSFKLPEINSLIQAYTPAKILGGTADEISFSGMIHRTGSEGTMKFLYHGLEVDLQLKNQAKWKSSVLAFAANAGLNSSNPAAADEPPRIVKFSAERDMNKGFFNIIIRSVLSGFKETMFMSKENRKSFKEAKRKSKQKKNK